MEVLCGDLKPLKNKRSGSGMVPIILMGIRFMKPCLPAPGLFGRPLVMITYLRLVLM